MSGGSWVGKHKKELLAALALGGVGALTGGFGLLGGAAAGAEAGAGAAAGGLAGADAVGAGAGGIDLLSSGAMANMPNGLHAISAIPEGISGGGLLGNVGNALDKFGKVQRIAGLLSPQQEPMQPMQMPGPRSVPLEQTSSVPSLQQTYGPVVDEETKRRLRAMMMRGGYGTA